VKYIIIFVVLERFSHFISLLLFQETVNTRKILTLNAELMQLQFPLANPISENETVSVFRGLSFITRFFKPFMCRLFAVFAVFKH